MQALTALMLLTGTLIRRLLREGIVLRSLVFPVVLTAGTLLLTLAVLSWFQGPDAVAVTGPARTDAALHERFREQGWRVLQSDDPAREVELGYAFGGTDGTQLWFDRVGRKELRLEGVVRGPDAYWAPHPPEDLPQVETSSRSGLALSRIMGGLFTLFGVVFGAGMVARDRDDGTLEAELSLAVPRWVHGASRWLAGASVLSVAFYMSMTVFDALLGVPDVGAFGRCGMASTAAAVAIGLMVIGRAGLKQGFSGPLSLGLTITGGLFGAGMVVPGAADVLPVASLVSHGDGWIPLLVSMGMGLLSVVAFTWRAARG